MGGVAEWPVERGGVLGGIGHYGHAVEAGVVQAVADRRHLAVHHARRRHDISAGLGLGDGGAGVKLQRQVVVHHPAGKNAAVAVGGVFAQAQVRDDRQLRILLYGADGLLDNALGIPGLGAFFVLATRHAEQQDRRDVQFLQPPCFPDHRAGRLGDDAGHRTHLGRRA